MSIFNADVTKRSSRSPLYLSLLVLLFVYGCALVGQSSSNYGHIRGIRTQQSTYWKMEVPPNMVFIPGGVFKSGVFDQSLIQVNEPAKTCSVDSFYIDQYPITNAQYWEFIDDVLGQTNQEEAPEEQDLDNEFRQTAPYDTTPASTDAEEDSELMEAYTMKVLYPDLSELRDIFGDAEADHYIKNYFEQGRPGGPYANFPVLGICYEAAQAFCKWRSERLNAYRERQGLSPLPNFELPTAEQREYAARGGYQMAIYPWGGPYT
ncbi:MAG: SUMF1/EgtB/PvdO family nonheme iron enzyme, partial [Bacteroidota bacterium]